MKPRVSKIKPDKMESAMRVIITACDEAIAANEAGLDMTWYEANIAFAVANALKVLSLGKRNK